MPSPRHTLLPASLACGLLLPMLGASQHVQRLEWQVVTEGAEAPAFGPDSLRPDGSCRRLVVLPGSASPAGASLPLPAGRVRWAGVVPDSVATLTEHGLQWIGDLEADPPSLEELSALVTSHPCLPVPPGLNLAAHMDWTPFGIEERVIPRPDSELAWQVDPGHRPAGLYSAQSWRLPTRPARDWQLELRLRGQGTLRLGLAAETRMGFGDPETLHELPLSPEARTHRLPLSKALADAKALRLSLVAGEQAADFVLESLRWLPSPPAPEAVDSAALPLGVWDWSANPARWLELRPLWRAAGVRLLQLALPRHTEEGPPAFLQTLQMLREDGFEVVAVEGDPHMVLPSAAPSVRAQHLRLAQWPELAAVQYDVEPYLLPGFRLETERWYGVWGELYATLAGLAPTPVEAVVPFWLLHQKQGPELLAGLARHCQRVVVMNYRSDPVEALAWASAWLEWSHSRRLPVGLAIECGPVPDSPRTRFHRANRGTLWLAPWPGEGTAVVLFEEAMAPVAGSEMVCEATQHDQVLGSRTSMENASPRQVRALLDALRASAASLQMPASLTPRLLLHEPSVELLRELGR